MALSRRAQSETASTTDAEIVRLALGLDRHPIAVNESLRVHHSWFRAAEGAVAPDDRLCAYDHQRSRLTFASAAASFRMGSRIACGTCPFMGDSRVDIHVNLGSFSRSDFDRLRLCTQVPGPRPCTSL